MREIIEKIGRKNDMRVMLDTNILISLFIFKSKKIVDKDFMDVKIERPEIMTTNTFLEKYVYNKKRKTE